MQTLIRLGLAIMLGYYAKRIIETEDLKQEHLRKY